MCVPIDLMFLGQINSLGKKYLMLSIPFETFQKVLHYFIKHNSQFENVWFRFLDPSKVHKFTRAKTIYDSALRKNKLVLNLPRIFAHPIGEQKAVQIKRLRGIFVISSLDYVYVF